jgi:hypothetical protein
MHTLFTPLNTSLLRMASFVHSFPSETDAQPGLLLILYDYIEH